MNTDEIMRLLKIISNADDHRSLWWKFEQDQTQFVPYINCNDVFFWGCADLEDVRSDTLDELMQAYMDGVDDGAWLYCARMRKMRPQGAAYKFIDKENWPLFDACGPEREVEMGNPEPRPV